MITLNSNTYQIELKILNFIETKIKSTAIDVNRKIKPKVFPQELLAQEVLKLIND